MVVCDARGVTSKVKGCVVISTLGGLHVLTAQ